MNNSRALICELLAMRLLKEHSTRELIDALSYDFNPLQGLVTPGTATPGGVWSVQSARSARTSTIEVAIRAQAKKFLAHPLVVQQLEAIWAGTIVFHSVADSLHRKPEPLTRQYRTFDDTQTRPGPSRRISPTKQPGPRQQDHIADLTRKTVTLYDPHDASLFKLSRLRVPRYRNLFSTLSYGIMLALFLAVLAEKSDDITALEVLFWVWSAGYMLDEIVGFSEQGFGLYIMSVWNAFDLGILLMFLFYYVLRLMGILMPDVHSRHDMASLAYDVLGSTAVLLFPRLFSALDHYRYFSQLLIAFRMMAMDLVAILVLIVISCSGFFVAFTLAFKKDVSRPRLCDAFARCNANSNQLGPSDTLYSLFQLLMGFTPAAWDIWVDANILGKMLLALFLFICHFLIVTILVTVLTNSFMAVVQNANEEHQFLFAVNTISMVKTDALFAHIAPTNLLGWLLIPLKYCMSFKTFVRMNRLLIKVTHIPILFSIFLYERVLLSNLAYSPTDLVEHRGRTQAHAAGPAFSIRGPLDVFSPGNRLREPSITTFHKDRALEEVFRRPFRDPSVRERPPLNAYPQGRRNSSNVVSDWMKRMGTEGGDVVAPQDDSRSTIDRLEWRKRPILRRTKTAGQAAQRRHKHPLTTTRAASDPDDLTSPFTRPIPEEEEPEGPQQTEDDGDDELLTNDEEEHGSEHTTRNSNAAKKESRRSTPNNATNSEEEYFRTPMTVKPRSPIIGTPARAASPVASTINPLSEMSPSKRRGRNKPGHNRNLSTNTILFSPTKDGADDSTHSSDRPPPRTATRSGTATPGRMPTRSGTTTPGRMPVLSAAPASRPRPIMPPAQLSRQNTNIANFVSLNQRQRQPSFNAMALDLASDIGDNNPRAGAFGGLPASFSTQLEMAARMKAAEKGSEEEQRINRIIMSRMTNLEEGFRDIAKELKGLKRSSVGSDGTRSPPSEMRKGKGKAKAKKKIERREEDPRMGSSL